MAPSPENDNPPKAPDKEDKSAKPDGSPAESKSGENKSDENNKETAFLDLNEKDLKNLLDEAISYKSPKDREGKSELFNNLLTDAENELRNARATSASGPETVRHYNKRATKRHGKGNRKASSISENLTHSGSLNNLAKEELFEETIRQRPVKTVSARQREGGSLPCNVNVTSGYAANDFFGTINTVHDIKSIKQFVDVKEVEPPNLRHRRDEPDMDSLQGSSTKHKKGGKSVDDTLPFSILDHLPINEVEVLKCDSARATTGLLPNNTPNFPLGSRDRIIFINPEGTQDVMYRNRNLPMSLCNFDNIPSLYAQKVDENCNAVAQQSVDGNKKKSKKAKEKNVTVLDASQFSGYRGDIINDVDKLMDFIEGSNKSKEKSKPNIQKSQKLNKNISIDDSGSGKGGKKQRTRSKPKNGENLQKSNSLEEISTTKMEDFEFMPEDNVVLRQSKSSTDRPRERRSWGTDEPLQVQNLYANASAENLENVGDFHMVVPKKKKSKKQRRRSSLSSRGKGREESSNDFNRALSPEHRRKSAISVPHSEKSNDSSDVDSVHSLPIDAGINRSAMAAEPAPEEDGSGFPISYADIAKNSSNSLDRPKSKTERKKTSGERSKAIEKQLSTETTPETSQKSEQQPAAAAAAPSQTVVEKKKAIPKEEPPKNHQHQKVVVNKQPPPSLQQAVLLKVAERIEEKTNEKPPDMNSISYVKDFPSIPSKDKSPGAESKTRNPIAEIQTWPAIPNNKNFVNKNDNNQKATSRNAQSNHFKNAKNASNVSPQTVERSIGNSVVKASTAQIINNFAPNPNETIIYNNYNMPINIPDVTSIEMQLKNNAKLNYNWAAEAESLVPFNSPPTQPPPPPPPQPRMIIDVPVQIHTTRPAPEHLVNCAVQCDWSPDVGMEVDRTTVNSNNNNRPAVVILSGSADRDVSGLTFGFEINEQLLTDGVTTEFLARYVPPNEDVISQRFNLDKIVSYIGSSFDDVMTDGSVQYYNENL